MKKRLRIAALLILMLALACAHPQQAEAPDTPAPAEQTDPVEVVATPVSDTVSYEATPEPLVPTPTPTPTPVPTPTPSPTPAPLEGVTIGLDPGHQQRANFSTEPIAPGEKTEKAKCSSGTRGIVTGVYEYEVNLKVALKLRRLLEQNGATVVLTRTTNNVNLSNRSRAEYFNDREVDLAILLYCNGADDTGIRGAFMLLPTKERTSFFSENARAATTILEHYCAATGLPTRKGNGIVYTATQTAFNWCTRPIICIEMGHLSNESDDLLLTNNAFQDKMAVGIYEGIFAYLHPDSASEGGD